MGNSKRRNFRLRIVKLGRSSVSRARMSLILMDRIHRSQHLSRFLSFNDRSKDNARRSLLRFINPRVPRAKVMNDEINEGLIISRRDILDIVHSLYLSSENDNEEKTSSRQTPETQYRAYIFHVSRFYMLPSTADPKIMIKYTERIFFPLNRS